VTTQVYTRSCVPSSLSQGFSSSPPLCSHGLKRGPESRSNNSTGIPVIACGPRTPASSSNTQDFQKSPAGHDLSLYRVPITARTFAPSPSQPVSCSRISLSPRLISKEGRPLTQHSPERRLLWSLAARIIDRSKEPWGVRLMTIGEKLGEVS
jgi:hypothetical protein